MSIDGTWNCVTKSPMGDQKTTMTIVSNGNMFTGTSTGPTGASNIEDGRIDGDDISWSIKMTSPMPMTIEGKATVSGDALAGSVKAGAFGTWTMTGAKAA
jgi:hypothetical protein